jgi:hypothetical protein
MAASPASATCSPDTRRPTGSARGHAFGGHAAGGDTTGDRCDSCDKPPSHDTSRRQRPNSWLGSPDELPVIDIHSL